MYKKWIAKEQFLINIRILTLKQTDFSFCFSWEVNSTSTSQNKAKQNKTKQNKTKQNGEVFEQQSHD